MAAEDGLHGARVGHLQGAAIVVPQGKEHGHVLRFQLALLDRVVRVASIRAGSSRCCAAERMMPLTSAANSAAGAACRLRRPARWPSGPAHTPQVVQVAADGARGQKTHRHVGIGPGRRHGRQEAQFGLRGPSRCRAPVAPPACAPPGKAAHFSMAMATCAASVVNTRSCSLLKKSARVCSRSSTPMMRPLWKSGTTSSERVSGFIAT